MPVFSQFNLPNISFHSSSFGVCIPRSSNCRYPSKQPKQPLKFSADFCKVDCVGKACIIFTFVLLWGVFFEYEKIPNKNSKLELFSIQETCFFFSSSSLSEKRVV